MFDRFKRDIRAQKFFSTAEEAMYFEQAAKEVANGEIQPGLHAMALSKCEGDEVKAKAMYLQLRVDMLKQEAAVGEKFMEAAEREAQEQAKREEQEKEIRIANEKVAQWEKRKAEQWDKQADFGVWVLFPLAVALTTIVASILFFAS